MADPTGIVLSERVKSVVGQKLIPSVVDGVFSGNILLYRLFNNTAPWTGGRSMERGVVVSKSNQGKSFSGAEEFATSVEDNKIRLAFPRKSYGHPVTVRGDEKTLAQTEAAQMDLVKEAMDEAKLNMLDDLGTIVYGDGTGNSGKDFNGTGNIIDDGSNATTYGGQTRSSYPTALNSDISSSVGSITLAHIAAKLDAATGTGGAETEPTLIVTTKTIYSAIEALMQSTLQNNTNTSMPPMRYYATGPMQQANPMMGSSGFKALSYRGVPIIADDLCPSGEMHFINEHKMVFHVLKDSNLQSFPTGLTHVEGSTYNNAPELSACQWRGWLPIPNQYAETGQFLIQGNLISWEPRRHAKSTGVTS